MPADFIVTLNDPREKKNYYLHETSVRRVVLPTAQSIFQLISTLNISGLCNLPNNGPLILAANHLSNFDVFLMQFALPRPIFYMGKEELFRNPIMDWLFRQLGGFPVYRGQRDYWALQHARQVLARGHVLGIFPEGRRNKGKGLQRGKSGAARLALETGCPIFPMAVNGPQEMFRRFPYRTKIHLTLGRPVVPQHGDSPRTLTNRVMFALASMLPSEMRGVYCGEVVC